MTDEDDWLLDNYLYGGWALGRGIAYTTTIIGGEDAKRYFVRFPFGFEPELIEKVDIEKVKDIAILYWRNQTIPKEECKILKLPVPLYEKISNTPITEWREKYTTKTEVSENEKYMSDYEKTKVETEIWEMFKERNKTRKTNAVTVGLFLARNSNIELGSAEILLKIKEIKSKTTLLEVLNELYGMNFISRRTYHGKGGREYYWQWKK